ncbi:putative carbon-nitrogen hydrolase [Actinoplanes missouriensis 431]|uniref:Putative carbon-nitrogen hydrolase n=1 Tax=Actinoplanes missouriensis (strain ATCC 14538 / DSM 43046 / CBS 188.64 / JCM 3121 / NBRC 102363 / NCIMB 12654 / NRRL B-3342 / UNCC 431) TaxID=512565 RepID=I0HDQ5_ACTM4|nr:nitrilase-related carbon-nitrogen hydrolase [Actinoplanes missouriensis]BAL91142.1 putative carbon-nitrogen hydrolase [Actinoplanes missouriensis 431]
MLMTFVVAQVPVSWDVEANLSTVREIVGAAHTGDVVVLPEGMLSGYGEDLSDLDHLCPAVVLDAVAEVERLARSSGAHVFCGSLLPVEGGGWCNAGLIVAPDGGHRVYQKINLAMNERGVLMAGSSLPTFPLAGGMVAVQLCREIRFPEQWQHLAAAGAQAFVYLTNAANPREAPGVWRSHLISRAAENQRFVVASNVAHPDQHCPSMVVSPRGEVLGELPPGDAGILRLTVDLAQAGEWYLGQRRTDVVAVTAHPTQTRPAVA